MRTVWVQRVSKALFICTLRWKHAVHSLPDCDIFHNPDSTCYFFMRVLCVVDVWLGQTSVNGNTTNLERVLYLFLTLDWRWSDVLLASTFTRGKRSHFWACRKCAQRLTHTKNEWRSSGVLVKSSTNSESRPANHNARQRITTHWPKFFIFCAMDVRDGMCDWAFNSEHCGHRSKHFHKSNTSFQKITYQ